jgi:hypothetical protein
LPKTLTAVAAAALMLVVAVAALAGPAPYPQALINQATKTVRSKAVFKKAILLEADGTPKAGTKVTTAAGIVNWRFVYDNQATRTRFKTVFVKAANGRLGQPVGNRSVFVEDNRIPTLPKMTLAAAITKLRAAGHKQPFGAVTLRYPLGPGFKEPLYIFTIGSRYWSVGTKTGNVKPIS